MHKDHARTPWAAFVAGALGDQRQSEAAIFTGIDQPTISRWLDGRLPSATGAIRFARAYGINPVQALVAAGLLDDDDTTLPTVDVLDALDRVPTGRLIAELARRDTTEAAS